MRQLRAGLTTRATCLLAAGITAVLCGIVFGEVDLVRAGVLAAALPLIASFVVNRARVRIANRRQVEPTHTQSGGSVTVHLTITNRALLRTSSLMLEDSLPEQISGRARFVLDSLSAHEARQVSYRIPALGRGHYRVGPLRMRVADPFGLIDLTRSFSTTSEFVVAPIVEPLPAIDPPRSEELGDIAGGGSIGTHGADDQSTREYRTGDDLRKIHWRSSARTGALMVRQEERPWQGENTVLLDMRAAAHITSAAAKDTPDEPTDVRLTNSFEWAVSAVASIGTHVMMSGRRLSLVADPNAGERLRFGDPTRLSSYLAEVRPSGRGDLTQMAHMLRESARDSTLIAVLGRVDSAALRALADAHARRRSAPAFAILLDVESWSAPWPPAADHLGIAEPGIEIDASTGAEIGGVTGGEVNLFGGAETRAAVTVLHSAGWRVAVVQRGQSVAEAWRTLMSGSLHMRRAGRTGALR